MQTLNVFKQSNVGVTYTKFHEVLRGADSTLPTKLPTYVQKVHPFLTQKVGYSVYHWLRTKVYDVYLPIRRVCSLFTEGNK